MIINRALTPHLLSMAQYFPAVALMGPRQSGKTTLAKIAFPNYSYVSLEDLEIRREAQQDPRGFLQSFSSKAGVIIDEVQEVPELFSYMQGIIDADRRPGRFILTGSQNFILYEKITQSLAGRIALLTLLPLSLAELQGAGVAPQNLDALLLKGFYPELQNNPVDPRIWGSSYISSYIEKDVRQVLRISDVVTFQNFLKLCAARTGNLLNYADLARDCDISPNTAKNWISILETSYIIKLITPYYRNFNKRIVKTPKLYFYDPALICTLLGIKTPEELFSHPIKGALFESFVISEILKHSYNNNEQPSLYFWRDTQGHEIDCVIEKTLGLIVPIEIKSGKTFSPDFFKGLHDWQKITDQADMKAFVLYGGIFPVTKDEKKAFPWSQIEQMLDEITNSPLTSINLLSKKP